MKRNKHTNIVNDPGLTVGQQTTGMDLIMKTADGSLVKAVGVQLAPEFKALAERLQKEKGVSKESAEAIAANATIWTPDMVEKPNKKRTAKSKKVTEEEKPKKSRKTAKKTEEEKAGKPKTKKPRKTKKE